MIIESIVLSVLAAGFGYILWLRRVARSDAKVIRSQNEQNVRLQRELRHNTKILTMAQQQNDAKPQAVSAIVELAQVDSFEVFYND